MINDINFGDQVIINSFYKTLEYFHIHDLSLSMMLTQFTNEFSLET